MRRRRGGDASFLIGIILGVVVGAAIAVILAEAMDGDRAGPKDDVEQARESLETTSDSSKARITGASEGSAPA